MHYKPLRQRRNGGGRAYSIINRQRGVNYHMTVEDNGPKNITCEAIQTGDVMLVSELDVYGATYESWRAADRKSPHSEVLRELLAQGATLATTKALFRA